MSFAVLCPGQGGQHDGMFDLLAGDASGREAIARAGMLTGIEFLLDRGEPNKRLFQPNKRLFQPNKRLFGNAVAQPAICTVAVATWSVLGPRLAAADVVPTLFGGYSVGELAAYGCAGALSFDDTLLVARDRAAAMDAASRDGDGLLALRGLSVAEVTSLCRTVEAHLAIVNGEDQVIVGGRQASLDRLVEIAGAAGAAAQRLPVAVAAHTPLLADAVEPFRARLGDAAWHRPTAPVLAGIDGSTVRDPAVAIDRLARQLATTVRWSACMDGLAERGVTTALELGPGNALSRLLRERHPSVAVRSVADFRSFDAVVDWIARTVAG